MTISSLDKTSAAVLNSQMQTIQDAIDLLPTNTPIVTGQQVMFAGSSAPTGWLLCDGSAVSRSTYTDLFLKIGTTYGAGDGVTTFNVPDHRGRMLVGSGTGPGLTARAVGDKGGSQTVALTADNEPSHTHNVGSLTLNGGATGVGVAGSYLKAGSSSTQNQPSGAASTPHQNMQPYSAMSFIIKV